MNTNLVLLLALVAGWAMGDEVPSKAEVEQARQLCDQMAKYMSLVAMHANVERVRDETWHSGLSSLSKEALAIVVKDKELPFLARRIAESAVGANSTVRYYPVS